MSEPLSKSEPDVRPLRADDLEAMIAIDRAYTGEARRRFFEKRLAAAAAHPEDFIHAGVSDGGRLVGFAFARVLRGEFGRDSAAAALDIVGVDASMRQHGYGHKLMDGLTAAMRSKGVRRLHSQAEWTNDGLLRFFSSLGFNLSPRLVLERPVVERLAEPVEDV